MNVQLQIQKEPEETNDENVIEVKAEPKEDKKEE